MGDYVETQVGTRLYRVYGLDDLAGEIEAAAASVWWLVSERLGAATSALEPWRGPHAEAFADRVNSEVLGQMVDFRWALLGEAARCREFPNQPYLSVYGYGDEHYSARAEAVEHDPQAEVGAETDRLRDFTGVGPEQDGQLTGFAETVTTDGLRAEVAEQLTPSELEEAGYPDSVLDTEAVWATFEAAPVSEVLELRDLTMDAARIQMLSGELGVWTEAVAGAIDDADDGRLELLLAYPELAGLLDDDPDTGGPMNGAAALDIMALHFADLDIAAHGGDADGEVSANDLRAVAEDPDAPEELRASAQYMLDNPLLFSQLQLVNEPVAYELQPDRFLDGTVTQDDLSTFRELNASLRAIGGDFDAVDTARQDGDGEDADPDGYISENDLRVVAESDQYDEELRDAAQFLLDHPRLTQRLLHYEHANFEREVGSGPDLHLTDDVAGFNYEGLLALTIDQQAFAGEPEAARELVTNLSTADHEGNGGLSIYLASPEGVEALANTALMDARFDLTDQHAVIAHLPETTAGTRNQLITGFYDVLAGRAEQIFAGPDLAGHPDVEGHPGATWANFGTWASYEAGRIINGDNTLFGVTTSTVQQAGADGNQWIFNDVGGKFAAFVELYERNPDPTPVELQQFFNGTFGEGDGATQTAFAAFVAAEAEADPVRRQELLFQGNAFIGYQEQAGIDVYLHRVSPSVVLDAPLSRWMDLRVGREVLDLDHDVPSRPGVNNHLPRDSYLELDVTGLTPEDFSGPRTVFSLGDDGGQDVVNLSDLAGIEAMQPDLTQSMPEIFDDGSLEEQNHVGREDPSTEGLVGSGATNWLDWEQRMNFIVKFFGEFHTDLELWNTGNRDISLDTVTWLDEEVRPDG